VKKQVHFRNENSANHNEVLRHRLFETTLHIQKLNNILSQIKDVEHKIGGCIAI
jgi:hypothetical protein